MPARSSFLGSAELDEQVLAEVREHIRERIRQRMPPSVRAVAGSEDVAQSAMREMLAARKNGQLRRRDTQGAIAYALATALHKIANLWRRVQVEKRQAERRPSQLLDGDPSPGSQAGKREELRRVLQARDQLSSEDQAALRHYYDLGRRGAELGESLGLSASAADHRVCRARERLKSLLLESGT